MEIPTKVKIVEMGPRDGLQNEPKTVPLERKVELIDRLTENGFRFIEVGSFVSPKWIPQMADTAKVMDRIQRKDDVIYSVLVPNRKGFDFPSEFDKNFGFKIEDR